MIDETKIRMMTKVAMIQKKQKRQAIEICGYRKKDYVSFQMIKVWICSTAAYAILLAFVFVYAAGTEMMTKLSYEALRSVAVSATAGYLIFITIMLIITKKCSNKRYRAASAIVRSFRQYLMKLEDYYMERNQTNDSTAGASTKNK